MKEVVCEMSQTNRIKLISRNSASQRLYDPFNSLPRCPLNAEFQPPAGHDVQTTDVLEDVQHKFCFVLFFYLMLYKTTSESLCSPL